jgi:glycosyltransferase involved in cell wall biosynthesis
VYAHDLDTFRCLLDPPADPRPGWYCRLVGRTLAGLRAARLVFHNSAAVGQALLAAGLVPVDRLVHAPLGVAAEFTPAGGDRPNWLPAGPFVLHVGSCIPRKRMDVLLDVFAAVRPAVPGLRLVKVGPPWTADQAARRDRHGLTDAVVTAADLSRAELAAVYRAAAVVLLPSDAEGFGLPLIEALACGAAVVASDLPVLREVGGPAVVYAPVADVPAWAAAVRRVLTDPTAAPPPQVRRRQAELYSWGRHAAVIADAYRNLWGELCAASSG